MALSDAALRQKTGKTWGEWCEALDAAGAAKLPPAHVAQLVLSRWPTVGAWWAQVIAAGYPRHRARSVPPPRRSSRSPETTRSALVAAPVSEVYDAFADDKRRRRWLRGAQPEVQSAIRDRTVNLRWPTGERVVVVVTPDGGGGTRVTVRAQLGPTDSATAVRARWDQELLLLQSWLRKQTALR